MLLLTAKLLAAWPPTRRAGLLIEGRRIWSPGQTLANWRDYPLRSAGEACSFVGITLGVYASRSLTLAVQAGAFSGMVVCLLGELFAPSEGQGEDRSAWMLPLCVCAYSIVVGLHTVFTQAPLPPHPHPQPQPQPHPHPQPHPNLTNTTGTRAPTLPSSLASTRARSLTRRLPTPPWRPFSQGRRRRRRRQPAREWKPCAEGA